MPLFFISLFVVFAHSLSKFGVLCRYYAYIMRQKVVAILPLILIWNSDKFARVSSKLSEYYCQNSDND